MTLQEWYKRHETRVLWREFYKSEDGQCLKKVLMHLGMPTATMPPQGVDFIDWNAMVNSRREGFFEAIKLLDILTEEASEKSDLPPPWEKTTNETNINEDTYL
jgi:hypothetical protein